VSAERLRAAAVLMRRRAEDAQHADAVEPGRWMTEHHGSQYHDRPDTCHIAEDRSGIYWTVASEVYIPNAEHMAGLDPFTGLRIAEWLERAARRWWWLRDRTASAVADAYLGGKP
jgi:hypothetical protein